VETCKQGRGLGGNCLGIDTAPLPCCGWAGDACTLETVFFCKNSQSYKKNQNWRSSVHVQVNSMCTDDHQRMNQSTSAAGKRSEFWVHGGGISMVSKIESCLLLVSPVFESLKQRVSHQNRICRKMIPGETKK
jgi:hypothetical protein